MMVVMLRWLTAGESHGQALVATLEGLPAGVECTTENIKDALARRRLGYGRGARMKFEADAVTILGGIRHGISLGSPIALTVGNTEWPKWEQVMNSDPVDSDTLDGLARNAPLTRPRPGHADLAGMQKYGFDDARPVLERASARETAARVALGTIAAAFLKQAADIIIVSHTTALGSVSTPAHAPTPNAGDVETLDQNPLRCFCPATTDAMVAEVDAARKDGDTLGGVVEIVAYGLPPGLGSYTHWDRRLDAQLAAAMMGIQAIKGVEIGDGFVTAARRGSQAHDETEHDNTGRITRRTHRAGGIEGGMSIGGPVTVRAAMKPISTVPRALDTVDVTTGQAASAINQRSDVCAVPAAGVVGEAMMALTLAGALLDKCGGDSVTETRRNLLSYLDAIPSTMQVPR